MRPTGELLFRERDLQEVLERKSQQMVREVESIARNQLLNASVDDLCAYLVEKYTVQAPELRREDITAEDAESKVDVSRDWDHSILDRGRPFYVAGTEVSVRVPFDGDGELFQCKPSTFTYSPPRGVVRGNELVLGFVVTDHNAQTLQANIGRVLEEVEKYLGWVRNAVAGHNGALATQARNMVESRRNKVLKDQGLAASLGFPVRRRGDAPATYRVPEVRRRITPRMPEASTEAFKPEPGLAMEEYEHMLSVIQNMILVMERSPGAFANMGEEHLRDHCLVQLNGQYEGQATGETFNANGKTDILIRHEGKNLFIAECKFWDGPKSLVDAIDQLLGYATWRDGKLALLLFNRRKDFSAVLGKVAGVVAGHANCKRQVKYEGESGFRFVLHHRDDKNRELILTVLAFEVPA